MDEKITPESALNMIPAVRAIVERHNRPLLGSDRPDLSPEEAEKLILQLCAFPFTRGGKTILEFEGIRYAFSTLLILPEKDGGKFLTNYRENHPGAEPFVLYYPTAETTNLLIGLNPEILSDNQPAKEEDYRESTTP